MAKSKARTSRKAKPMPPEARAAQKKANDARARRLLKEMRAHARMGKQFAALMGITAENIPASLKRDMEAAHRKAYGAKPPRPVRLKPTDPKPGNERGA
ncbi:MAG TPA: hypothetical protein VMW18_00480 [Candidatus Binatia bacterium]|nr:hypothetical protein [Candidatus Binatia bacterium]